ncbi:hypothetical protein CEXT_215531 [Caerostris extrusa]|uniref:Uncharacterized protein n=1 Tax=Caerostris extrusa TaxID=172846 RepID=A0AAV4QXB7_CAEEX|nr:hypothetical protein CEXT_215531 [Caerostris extrusa]
MYPISAFFPVSNSVTIRGGGHSDWADSGFVVNSKQRETLLMSLRQGSLNDHHSVDCHNFNCSNYGNKQYHGSRLQRDNISDNGGDGSELIICYTTFP